MTLPANGVSVKPGGVIEHLILSGEIVTEGDNVTSLDTEGEIGEVLIKEGIVANGLDAIGIAVSAGGPDHVSVKDVLSGKVKEGDYVTVQGHIWTKHSLSEIVSETENGHVHNTTKIRYGMIIDPTDPTVGARRQVLDTCAAVQKKLPHVTQSISSGEIKSL